MSCREISCIISCITEHWRTRQLKSAGLCSAQKDNDTLYFLAADIQFYSQLQDRLLCGEIVPIDVAQADNLQHVITRAVLKEILPKKIDIVEFTRLCDPSKSPLIHATASRSAGVEDMVHTISKKEVQTIF